MQNRQKTPKCNNDRTFRDFSQFGKIRIIPNWYILTKCDDILTKRDYCIINLTKRKENRKMDKDKFQKLITESELTANDVNKLLYNSTDTFHLIRNTYLLTIQKITNNYKKLQNKSDCKTQ